jgi:phage-related protein
MHRALHAGEDVFVVHVFIRKSHRGIETPLHHVDLAASRLKRLSEILRHGWN